MFRWFDGFFVHPIVEAAARSAEQATHRLRSSTSRNVRATVHWHTNSERGAVELGAVYGDGSAVAFRD